MFNSIGPLELGIVLLIVLLIFGPKRLPGLGRQLGSGMREFKDGITGKGKGDDEEAKPELSSAEQAFGEKPAATTTVAAEDPDRP
jgi:sec-independent protein translocase protein TatA